MLHIIVTTIRTALKRLFICFVSTSLRPSVFSRISDIQQMDLRFWTPLGTVAPRPLRILSQLRRVRVIVEVLLSNVVDEENS